MRHLDPQPPGPTQTGPGWRSRRPGSSIPRGRTQDDAADLDLRRLLDGQARGACGRIRRDGESPSAIPMTQALQHGPAAFGTRPPAARAGATVAVPTMPPRFGSSRSNPRQTGHAVSRSEHSMAAGQHLDLHHRGRCVALHASCISARRHPRKCTLLKSVPRLILPLLDREDRKGIMRPATFVDVRANLPSGRPDFGVAARACAHRIQFDLGLPVTLASDAVRLGISHRFYGRVAP